MTDPMRLLAVKKALDAAARDFESMIRITRRDAYLLATTGVEAWLHYAPDDITLDEFKGMWSALWKMLDDEEGRRTS